MILEKINTIEQAYKDFVIEQKHPCIIANAVFQMDEYKIKVYDTMTSDTVIKPILSDIEAYINTFDFTSNSFETLMICFKDQPLQTEKEFETDLWDLLQKLHDQDNKVWDPKVSQDPNHPDFSFSIKGKAFFIIGMHPNSSRMARRAPYTTVVFNLHWQFEKLRDMGTFQSVKKRIRKNDKKLQGHINPVLQDHGDDSETKQYSGRHVESNWKCPFHAKSQKL